MNISEMNFDGTVLIAYRQEHVVVYDISEGLNCSNGARSFYLPTADVVHESFGCSILNSSQQTCVSNSTLP